jgi:ABC-type lipoprotein release transport system permease subunit
MARALGDFLVSLARGSTWRLALRGLGRQPRRSAIVLAAVAIGLGSLLLAMALQYGLVAQMAETAIRTEIGDLQAHARDWKETAPLEARLPEAESLAALGRVGALQGIAPRLRGEALAQSPRASVGVRVLGVDPEREPSVSNLARSLREGAWLREPRRVVIGSGHGDLTGEALRVGGIVEAPSRELDEAVVLLRLEDAQRLFGVPGEISELALAARDPERLDDVKTQASAALGAVARVETWRELEPLLNMMIALFDQMGWVIYAAIFVAMAFGIANVLLMSVLERTREIGVLLAIGMPPARMVAIVLAESVVLVALGVGLGFALGFSAILALRDGIDLSALRAGLRAFGVPTRLVPVARSGDVWAPIWVAGVTALVASLWPALRAVRTRPAEALRRV